MPSANGRQPSPNGVLFPLDYVYWRSGIAGPRAEAIEPKAIPLPYRALLDHGNDMTLTLEKHFGSRVALRPLTAFMKGPWYFRRVLLVREDSGRPVEMGAIRIKLAGFPQRIRKQILKGDVPLSRVLRAGRIDYQRRTKTFLALAPNSEMMGVFWMPGVQTLFGRRTEMICRGAKIGDIVEILPLVEPS